MATFGFGYATSIRFILKEDRKWKKKHLLPLGSCCGLIGMFGATLRIFYLNISQEAMSSSTIFSIWGILSTIALFYHE